ncbi:UDP-N-acetylmuramoyl-L-alanyl-D-glutamate--2,6-diaminopimelate ligase [Patescibacteria group bacterium]|nr:UDP-N-acetylmuramoyl-L-alanyl-D-glutamate--2,6-diaminopimelate ligase [Patescibacteria group bacterium]MBU0964539.1 UDP-N-acetylmuramoyl-L-alanyl-D-glutamate--2,6-diaminopimelate ligase [Patescibacteria group bacterium]
MKKIIRKLVPKYIINAYHWALAKLGAFIYGRPSSRLIVIGVTGTKGKSTTVSMISKILEQAGYITGLISTINFKIADREWINTTKQTMPGRWHLQKLLSQISSAGCQYAIIETSSEGIAQFRHLGIEYDVAVFTNLSPEHIESHGSYEKYREAKSKLFIRLKNNKNKIISGKEVKKVIVTNLDDKESSFFAGFEADEKWGYSLESPDHNPDIKTNLITGRSVVVHSDSTEFTVDNVSFELQLLGRFNVYNAIAAIAVGYSQGVELLEMKQALEKITSVPGRMDEISNNRGFRIFVDYAHEPASLEAVYKTIKDFKPNKIISILGSQGGGRDKAKRPILGKLAAQYTDHVIVTNEDPYDEDPQQIIDDVAAGALSIIKHPPIEKIADREEAIKRALDIAQVNDIVIITGKGSETVMAVKDGKMVDWNDRQVVEKYIK